MCMAIIMKVANEENNINVYQYNDNENNEEKSIIVMTIIMCS